MKQGFRVSKIFIYLLVFFGLSLSLFGACGTDKGALDLNGSSDSVKNTTFYYKYTPSENGVLKLTVKNNYTSSGTRTLANVYGDNACSGSVLWRDSITKNNSKTSSDIQVVSGSTYYVTIVSSSGSDTSYTITGVFTKKKLIPVQTSSSDICYSKVSYGGLCIGGIGIGCRQTIELRNDSDKNLSNVDAYLNTSGLLNVTLFSDCGIDGKSGSCAEKNNIDLGPIGLLNRTINYELPDFPVDATHSIYSKALISASLFSGTNLYSTYVKDGVYYSSKVSKCGPKETSGDREFILRHQENIKGDMKAIGNTIMVPKSNSGCTTSVPDPASKNNNEYYMCKYSNDGTSAQLILPRSDSKVVWAGLYWQSIIAKNTDISSQIIKIKSGSVEESVTPDILDSVVHANKDYSSYKSYSAFADVTNLFTKNNWNAGVYTIKDIPAAYGAKIDSLGAYGAWSLVVVYDNSKDASEKLRNVSVFDGWKKVDNNTVNIAVSGFLTPTKGSISSRVAVFAAEGDRNISGDKLLMKKGGTSSFEEIGTSGNAFNSSISTDGTRTPSLINNLGIDIQNIEVGSRMVNSQTSAELQFYSNQDVYWPSMIAFSTELYVPDVCYDEELTFKGAKIGGSNVPEAGDKVDYKVMITNKGNEIAKGVKIEKDFDKPDELKYVDGSVSTSDGVGSSSQYDNGIDLLDRISVNIGSGANASQGGIVAKPNEYHFVFQGEIGDGDANATELSISENIYRVSYRNDLLGIDFIGIPIRKCVDFNNTFGAYIPVLGEFNVVRHGAVTNTNSLDPDALDNALYTQLVNKAFDVDVVSFKNDNTTLQAPTKDMSVTLSVVEVDNAGGCESAEVLSVPQTINFAKNTDKLKLVSVTATKASQNAVFKMVVDGKTICSRDTFAIRPASYSMDTNESTLKGGVLYAFDFKAKEATNTNASSHYNQVINNSVSKNATTTLVKPVDCNLSEGTEFIATNIPFVDGNSTALLRYNNVGEVKFTITDNEWTVASRDQSKGDCIVDSNSTVMDASGKIGCKIQSSKTLHFYPAKFNTIISLDNKGNGFTYLANDANMSAELSLVVSAQIDNNTTATNYTDKCFAKDVSVGLGLDNNSTLSWGTPQSRMKMFEAGGAINPSSFTIPASSFSEGVADKTYGLNFDRNATKLDNPFMVNSDDFRIESMSDGDTSGFTKTDTSSTATFGFGRAHITNQRYVGNGGEAKVFYEIYCFNGCDKSLLPNGVGSKNSDDTRWFINDIHKASTDGRATSSAEIAKANVTATISGSDEQKATISYGGAKGYPYKTTMSLETDDWLKLPDSNAYGVEFSKQGEWVGKKETTNTTQDNASPATNRRIQW